MHCRESRARECSGSSGAASSTASGHVGQDVACNMRCEPMLPDDSIVSSDKIFQCMRIALPLLQPGSLRNCIVQFFPGRGRLPRLRSTPPSNRGLSSMILPVEFPAPPATVSLLCCPMAHHLSLQSKLGTVGNSADLHAMFQDGRFVKSARVFCQPMFPLCRGCSFGG